jgi:hypothetical protein
MTPFALLLAAPIAELFGIRFWYVAGGIACVLVAFVSAIVPAIAKMEDVERPKGDVTVT